MMRTVVIKFEVTGQQFEIKAAKLSALAPELLGCYFVCLNRTDSWGRAILTDYMSN